MKKLTKAQLAELRKLASGPQLTYGSARTRVQNNLVAMKLACWENEDGTPIPSPQTAIEMLFRSHSDRCGITDAGRAALEER